jgi:hypothetical protein
MPFCLTCMEKYVETKEEHAKSCKGKLSYPCMNCGNVKGSDHDCPQYEDNPCRMTCEEIDILIRKHAEYPWAPTRINASTQYVVRLKSELAVRVRIVESAKQKQEKFGKIPLPTLVDVSGARFAILALQNIAPPDNCALSIGSLRSTGKELETPKFQTASTTIMLAAVSGEDNKVEAIQGFLGNHFGQLFQFGPSVNLQFVAMQGIGKGMSSHGESLNVKVCAEPKLMGSLVPLSGMTTIWVGTKLNPWPLFEGERGFGSPMVPCKNCCSASMNFSFFSKEDMKWMAKNEKKDKQISNTQKGI